MNFNGFGFSSLRRVSSSVSLTANLLQKHSDGRWWGKPVELSLFGCVSGGPPDTAAPGRDPSARRPPHPKGEKYAGLLNRHPPWDLAVRWRGRGSEEQTLTCEHCEPLLLDKAGEMALKLSSPTSDATFRLKSGETQSQNNLSMWSMFKMKGVITVKTPVIQHKK